ncbi:MAG: ferritin-like domain-containing protein [Polyangiales bacterium]
MESTNDTNDTRATKLVGWGVGLAMLPVVMWAACATNIADPDDESSFFLWIAACVAAFVGIVLGVIAIRRGTKLGYLPVVLGLLTPVITFFLGVQFATFSRGRALRRRGKGRLPESEANEDWRDLQLDTSDLETCEAAAAGWRLNAATEHASIAAFSSFSNQLLALGAPSALVENAHLDAIDEVHHARVCYEISTGFADGSEAVGAGPLPAAVWPADGKTTPQSVAEECLVECCVLESASADAAARMAESAESPTIRAALTKIAADEARHAQHGWEALAWLWPQLSATETQRVVRALEKMKTREFAGVVPGSELERFGLAGSATWESAVCDAIAAAELRLGDLAVERKAAA